jgi:hypothetical protein
MRRDREQRRPQRNSWVNMSQQRNPEPRFASRYDNGEVPDPLGHNDWDGDYGYDDGPEVIV